MLDGHMWSVWFKDKVSFRGCELTDMEAFDLMIKGCYYCGDTSYRRLNTGKQSVSSADHPLSKKIYQFALDGTFIRPYDSVAEAVEDVGGNQGNISACALGQLKSAYKFKWSYIPPENI